MPQPEPSPEIPVCASSLPFAGGMLDGGPLPGLDDPEGASVPDSLPPVIDGHVHLFPAPLFEAIWKWFDRWGWPIRYQLHAEAVVDFLLDRGLEQIVALHYAHKPGIARAMNSWMADLTRDKPRVTGLATVFPGEEGSGEILAEAFELGLAGVKLHCHVQCFAADDEALEPVYRACEEASLPLVMHCGREPKSPGYGCDPHALCDAERTARVLRDHPELTLCVPHLGADEFEAYECLLEQHDNLWLDTTMMLADYFDTPGARRLLDVRPERVLYGTDFPNLPYAWDRELKQIDAFSLSEERLAALLGENARTLFGLS